MIKWFFFLLAPFWCFCFRQTKTQWAISLPGDYVLALSRLTFVQVFGCSAFFLLSFISFSFVPRTLVSHRNLFCTGYLLSPYAKLEMRISVVINRCHRFSTWNLFSVLMLRAARRGKGERKRENGRGRMAISDLGKKWNTTAKKKKIFEFSLSFFLFSIFRIFRQTSLLQLHFEPVSDRVPFFVRSRSAFAFRVEFFKWPKTSGWRQRKWNCIENEMKTIANREFATNQTESEGILLRKLSAHCGLALAHNSIFKACAGHFIQSVRC